MTQISLGAGSGTPVAGKPAAQAEGGAIRPFSVHFSDEDLADLTRLIGATRWPEREIVPDQSQGGPARTAR